MFLRYIYVYIIFVSHILSVGPAVNVRFLVKVHHVWMLNSARPRFGKKSFFDFHLIWMMHKVRKELKWPIDYSIHYLPKFIKMCSKIVGVYILEVLWLLILLMMHDNEGKCWTSNFFFRHCLKEQVKSSWYFKEAE